MPVPIKIGPVLLCCYQSEILIHIVKGNFVVYDKK